MKLLQLVNGLKTSLEKLEGAQDLLAQVETLSDAVTPFEGINADEARTAIAELGRIRPEIETLKASAGQVEQLQAELATAGSNTAELKRQLLAAKTVNAAGILPEFQELLEPTIAGAAELDSKTGTFVLPDQYLDGLKAKYPSAFAAEEGAGTGGAATSGQSPEPAVTTYEVGNERVITGVEPGAYLAGSVQFK